jgi:Tol biopolymer transport system component
MPRLDGRVLALGFSVAIGAGIPVWAHGSTERISLGLDGAQGNGLSLAPAISADGRFVAFESEATNLVPGDSNSAPDVFVRDRRTGRTSRVSIGPKGAQSNRPSATPAISADGRFVAFYSDATNLVPDDTNDQGEVFLHDRMAGTTRRMSVGPRGVQADGPSFDPTISADGQFVAYWSLATNLVPDDTNDQPDVFIRDREKGTTRRLSVGPRGAQGDGPSFGPAISADGHFVALVSIASNLVPGDTNGLRDIFIRDRKAVTTRKVSWGRGGAQSDGSSFDPAISADGRFAAFESEATNLVPGDTNEGRDIFIRDRKAGTTRRVSVGPKGVQGDRDSENPAVSADGRFVVFWSFATDLVPRDTNDLGDVFVRDRETGTTRRMSVGPNSAQGSGDGEESDPAISADGRFVAFESISSNLVPGDTNGRSDVFVRILVP